MNEILQQTISFVRKALEDAEKGHDWFHTERVWRTAVHIQRLEGKGDLQVIELAALLHDISDPKFNEGDEEKGSRIAGEFLERQDLDRERILHIQKIIRHVSYKGGVPQEEISSTEFRIVQDADRLDAMGAIGIARAFHYGGHKNRLIYDPSVPLQEYSSSEEYRASPAPTINHFYEKLLKLKDLMNTETGKALARDKHDFMLLFLKRFYEEWDPKTGNSG